jgi:molybdate-binding protein
MASRSKGWFDTLGRVGVPVEHRYGSRTEAVAALDGGGCDGAGLHIPLGFAQGAALLHWQRWLVADDLMAVDVASRRQGLVVAAGNPRKGYALADLVPPDLRLINRQLGSGARLLLGTLLAQTGIAPAAITGFEQGEFTHAAVAAYVASGRATARPPSAG